MSSFNIYTNRRNSGQHTLEFVMLLILVVAGVIIAGPYVIRSWNAQVKGWDDGVKDSIEDPLVQAPPPGLTTNLCSCGAKVAGQCAGVASSACAPPQCARTHRLHEASCNPAECQCSDPTYSVVTTWAECVPDPACCDDWTDVAGDAGCGINARPNGDQADGSCLDGYRLQWRNCGLGVEWQCVDDPTCDFNCLGAWPDFSDPAYVRICDDDDVRLSNSITPTVPVAFGSCSAPPEAIKCEFECAPCHWPNPPPDRCKLFTDSVLKVGCGLGRVDAGTCPAGYVMGCCP